MGSRVGLRRHHGSEVFRIVVRRLVVNQETTYLYQSIQEYRRNKNKESFILFEEEENFLEVSLNQDIKSDLL